VWEDCHLEEHKSSGNEGSSTVIETLPRIDSKTVSVDSHRQYDSGGLSSESRGTHSFSLYLLCREMMLLCDSLQTVLTVRHVPGNQNLIADALSRFRVPVNTEWELHPVIFQAITLIWDRPLIDLFATSLNYKLETCVSPIPDKKAWAVDAMTISWKRMFNYIFPPFRFLHRILHMIREDGCKTILIVPAWPRQSWFPDCLLLSCAKPLRLPLRGDLLSQFKGKTFHQGLVAVRTSIRQRGFSEKATKRISGAVRQSTGAIYDSKWSIFCSWCLSKQIDSLSITAQQLAEFFLYLFEDKGHTPSTIKGYRSAIARTIHLSGGPDFGSDEFLSLMFKHVCIERPKQRRLVPAWNLGIVLKALQLSPFEPLDLISFKFLTYKCCFLLALATGRRRSELHALLFLNPVFVLRQTSPQLPFWLIQLFS
jgi:hypothetical protein